MRGLYILLEAISAIPSVRHKAENRAASKRRSLRQRAIREKWSRREGPNFSRWKVAVLGKPPAEAVCKAQKQHPGTEPDEDPIPRHRQGDWRLMSAAAQRFLKAPCLCLRSVQFASEKRHIAVQFLSSRGLADELDQGIDHAFPTDVRGEPAFLDPSCLCPESVKLLS